MPFTVQCSSCRSKFALPDAVFNARIKGKVVDLPCKHCQSPIHLDGTKAQLESTGSSPTDKAQQVAVAKQAALPTNFSETNLPSVKPTMNKEHEQSARTGETQAGFPSVAPGPTEGAAPQVVVGRIGMGAPKVRVPLPGGAKPKLASLKSKEREDSKGHVTLSAAELIDDDDYDLPTEIAPRPQPKTKPKASSRSSSAFKATMMGVAPPPSPTKLGGSRGSLSLKAQSGSDATASSDEAKPAAQRKKSAMKGTMLGLAPAPPNSGELAAVGFNPEELQESKADATAAQPEEGISDDIPRESATDLGMELEAEGPGGDEFGEIDADPVYEAARADDLGATQLNPDVAFDPQPDAPQHAFDAQSHQSDAVVEGADLQPAADEAPDWDAADSDVSKQIAQSLPKREAKPRRGRWLLAALVSVIGGVAVVALLIVQGHVNLPPQVQSKVAEYIPGFGKESPASATVGAQPAAPAAANPAAPPPAAATQEPAEKPMAKASHDEQASKPPAAEAKPKKERSDEPAAGSESGKVKSAAAKSGDGVLASPIDELPAGVRLGTIQDRLYRATKRAKKCHLSGRAVGDAQVIVTFAPNGRVQSSSVKGEPIASAPVADCIRVHMDSVLIPEFEGAPFAMSQPITLD
jgi:hypothetical protein